MSHKKFYVFWVVAYAAFFLCLPLGALVGKLVYNQGSWLIFLPLVVWAICCLMPLIFMAVRYALQPPASIMNEPTGEDEMSGNRKPSVESVLNLTPDSALLVVNTRKKGRVGFIVPTHSPFDQTPEEGEDDGGE